jgi:predicted nuclease of predicted toxin-antitoxin system
MNSLSHKQIWYTMKQQIEDLITRDSDVLGGTPVFAGTRVPVDSLLAHLKAGDTLDTLMRVLLDENLPRRLKRHLPSEWEVATVPECGWSGKKNGALMQLATDRFDRFITMDRGIEFQQNLFQSSISVMLLRAVSNRLPDLLPLIPKLIEEAPKAIPGVVVVVEVP